MTENENSFGLGGGFNSSTTGPINNNNPNTLPFPTHNPNPGPHMGNLNHYSLQPGLRDTTKYDEIRASYDSKIDTLNNKVSYLEQKMNDKKNEIDTLEDELKVQKDSHSSYKDNVKKLTSKMVLKIEQ